MSKPTALNERINRDFAHSDATGEQVASMEEVRQRCRELAHRLTELVPDGRELSLALTNLQAVMFWAHSGIANALPVFELPPK